MASTIIPKLAIKKEPCRFDKKSFIEVIPIARMRALLDSEGILQTTVITTGAGKTASYDNEKQQLLEYMKKAKDKSIEMGEFEVYYHKPEHKWGRLVVSKSLGCTAFRKDIRNTLILNNYYDFDLKNAQPQIILCVCKSNGIDCPMIEKYCSNRAQILKDTAAAYKLELKYAKELFLRLLFGGTWVGFVQDMISEFPDLAGKGPTEFISAFSSELTRIAEVTKQANMQTLWETVRKQKDKPNKLGSFYAMFVQEQEMRIMEEVMSFLADETDVLKYRGKETCIYEYDGLKLLKENVDRYENGTTKGKEALLARMNEVIRERTGFEVTMEEKPIELVLNLDRWLGIPLVDRFAETVDYLEKHATHKGIAKIIEEEFPGEIFYCNKIWYGWNREKSKWEKEERATIYRLLSQEVPLIIERRCKPVLALDEAKLHSVEIESKNSLEKKQKKNLGKFGNNWFY
jgi:hypothetical protein